MAHREMLAEEGEWWAIRLASGKALIGPDGTPVLCATEEEAWSWCRPSNGDRFPVRVRIEEVKK